jgi:hypothetical protein
MFNDPLLDKGYAYLNVEYPVLSQGLFFHKTHENKPIRFEKLQYLIDIYKDKSHHKVFKKGTQSCISEYLVCFAINKAIDKKNVFYILPTDVIKARFVQSRVNTTIEYTNFYKAQMKNIDSASMKSFGGIINFVGSNSQANFGEFVAAIIIIDEKNYCNQDNIVMAKERQAKQEMEDRYTIEASNPTILDFGIDISFNESDKKYWFIECDCNNKFNIDFFKHIVKKTDDNEYIIRDKNFDFESDKDCNIICDKCGKTVNRFGKGEWVAEKKSIISGYQFNQFFTSPTPIRNQLQHFNRGLVNDREMQRFYNAVLGEAYTSEGAKINKSMFEIGDFYQQDSSKNPCLLGIDVGNILHCVIGEIQPDRKIRIIKVLEARNFQDIIDLYRLFNIICSIIDSRPEARMSRQFVSTFKNAWMCDYLTESNKDAIDSKRKIIKIDRTTSLDGVKEDILLKNFIFPKDLPDYFVEHLEASTRIWQEKEGHLEGGRYLWVEGNKPDHCFHSLNYLNLCKKLLVIGR